MKVVNPGDWAREALQLQIQSEDEYQKFLGELVNKKLRVGEIASVNGSSLTAHYLFIEGKQTLVYVPREEDGE